ncbi:four-helix bundle copper-binding protein [Haloarculaceae archaeon H-GB2-1]|nr:four-helix bundle copper-binding protein [Haloarculaceae archaeon H-GB1-1]MEA5410073.1 four-helix bundle copper-binding protein [Haloarculaceae archaeon H-GB2-1]
MTPQIGAQATTQSQPAMQFGGTQQQVSGQGQQAATVAGAASDVTLDEALTTEMQQALQATHRAVLACEWCADRCADHGPEMAECIRLCRDVADLGSLSERSIARDSVYGPAIAEEFIAAAQECAQECARHQHRHCQACAQELSRAISATQQMLTSLGQSGQQLQYQQGYAQQTGTIRGQSQQF